MKTLILLILTLVFITSESKSQVFATWSEKNSGVTADLNCCSFSSPSAIWICGNGGTVLRSTNTGVNWVSLNSGGIPLSLDISTIAGIDQTTALVAGSNGTAGYIYKTTNSGANWVLVFTQPGGTINSIWMNNSNNGFMSGNPVGGRWSLWKTTNGGSSWDSAGIYLPQAAVETGFRNSMVYDSQGKVYLGTNIYRIYYSENLTAWTPKPTLGVDYTNAIMFLGGRGYIGNSAGLYLTTDNGSNWSSLAALPGSGAVVGITMMYASVWNPVWVARGSLVCFSLTGGSSWEISYIAPTGLFRHMAGFYNSPQNLVAVRSGGGISVANILTSGINQISSNIPSSFRLYQNYPNPFNPSTKIRFDISKQGDVELIVYDAGGKSVSTIVNSNLAPGEYEADFTAGELSSGIYFIKLTADKVVMTKKLILLK